MGACTLTLTHKANQDLALEISFAVFKNFRNPTMSIAYTMQDMKGSSILCTLTLALISVGLSCSNSRTILSIINKINLDIEILDIHPKTRTAQGVHLWYL